MNRKELQELLDIWNHSSVIKKKELNLLDCFNLEKIQLKEEMVKVHEYYKDNRWCINRILLCKQK